VKQKRSDKESRDGPLAAARLVPGKNETRIVFGKQRSAHFAGVVASATEVIPCSRDKFVTSTTSE
jgi:hypothetical protein